MGIHRFKPIPSGRMGVLWTLSTIRNGVVVEYGCMGHMLYSGVTLKRAGVINACKLYSTHINETDISFGDTTRLEKVIASIVDKDCPKAIFLIPSSVPEVIGVDMDAICKNLQKQYPDTHLIPFGCGGFDRMKHSGVQEALSLLVKTLPTAYKKTSHPTFNIIGSCADLFRYQGDVQEITRLVKGAFHMEPLCILSSDTSVEAIEQMGGAHINLVIRQEGKEAAIELKKRFQTPYYVGRPYGIEGTVNWLEDIADILGKSIDKEFLALEKNHARESIATIMPYFQHIAHQAPQEAVLSLGGHADVVQGIVSYGCNELSFQRGTCWCDSPDMNQDGIPYFTEEMWTEMVSQHKEGWLMASGEALKWYKKNITMQIANPDIGWRIYPYEPPFVGFRGAVHLANLWINAYESK